MIFVSAVALAAVTMTPPAESEAVPAPTSTKEGLPKTHEAAKPDTDEDETIVITGEKRGAGEVLGGVSVLDKEELTHNMKPSLGDTLADLPGVSSSSFGPSASRPILRGEQGERVRVLVDGIGSLDLSSTDPDHAVTINPLTAQRIEVLRGPGALLFGSSAIGGGGHRLLTRIPRRTPQDVRADVL